MKWLVSEQNQCHWHSQCKKKTVAQKFHQEKKSSQKKKKNCKQKKEEFFLPKPNFTKKVVKEALLLDYVFGEAKLIIEATRSPLINMPWFS